MAQFIKLDLETVRSMEEFHDLAVRQFSFPSYYGRNLDAFWDCITDVLGQTRVQITGYSSLEPALREKIDQYIDLLRDYEKKTEREFRVTTVE